MWGEGLWAYAPAAAVGLLLLLLLVQVILLRLKVKALTRKYMYFMAGENGMSVERKLLAEVTEIRQMGRSSEDMLHQHELLSHMQVQSFQRSGLVKYDAFDDTGDKLSFSLTLLDGANHGFVLTSLVGRETSRIYVKQVTDGKCREALSAEEAASINMALAGYMPEAETLPREEEPRAAQPAEAAEEKIAV